MCHVGDGLIEGGTCWCSTTMTTTSVAWAPAAVARTDDLWTCLASEDPEDGEGVFSVLNLDHDRFLEELAQDAAVGAVCGRLAALPAIAVAGQEQQDAAGGDGNAPRLPVIMPPSKASGGALGGRGPESRVHLLERMRGRIAADVARGRACGLLRANINAMRRPRSSMTAPVMASSGPEWRAAEVLQAAWRRFVLRHAFLHLREVVRQFSASGSRVALQSVNPREAHLADAASDIVVRFRLTGDESSMLPVLVYKMFTRRPVVDVCRGCCGRLLDCGAGAFGTCGTATARSAPAACGSSYSTPMLCNRGCSGSRSHSVCCLLFASYRRVENNDWRHCHLGLFDPERCPARGVARAAARGPARRRAAKRVAPSTAPGALGAAAPHTWATAAPVKKKISVQEKERLAKIALLRKLYGYGQGDEIVCPPPSPSPSSKRTTTPNQADDAPEAMVPHQDAENAVQLATGHSEHAASYSKPGDAYYDRLMASWGL